MLITYFYMKRTLANYWLGACCFIIHLYQKNGGANCKSIANNCFLLWALWGRPWSPNNCCSYTHSNWSVDQSWLVNCKYQIGRGPFGDVWLATCHQSADDYDEYHEVAVKMLHPLKEDDRENFWASSKSCFSSSTLCGVCWFHGISIIDERVSPWENNLE